MEPGITRFSFKHINTGIRSFLYRKLNPESPWWSKDAVEICGKLLMKEDLVLEFGSGRSTIWMAKRCAGITSIEHIKKWYDIVDQMIVKEKLRGKINYVYAPLEEVINTMDQPYLQCIPDSSFGIIIIDGKLRAYATILSLPKLKPGGILIIDDVHRYLPIGNTNDVIPESEFKEVWEQINIEIRNWRSIWMSDGIHYTAFFIKP